MGTAVSVIFFISIIVTFLVALPLLILSSIHLGRAMWICPRCARKNVRSICRKCGFDRGSAARSEIQFIGEWGAGSVAFVLVIWGSLGVFLSGLVFGVLTGVGVDGRTASMLGDLQLYLLILALTLYIISFRYGKGLRDIGLNLKNIKLSLLIGVGITVVAWIVDVIYTNLMILTPLSKYIKKGEAEMELVKLLRPSDLNFWLFLLTVAIIGPLVEEIVFRGLTHRGFKRKWGVKRAIIFGAVLFAGLHSWINFIPILILGLLLAWIYERTNDLTGCVIAHSMNNLLAVLTVFLR